jgi:hypothetical protein
MKTLTHWSRVPIRKPLLLGFGCPEGFGSGPAFHRCGKPFGPPSRRDNGALMTGHCDSIGAACNLEVGSLAVDSALNSVHRRSLSRYRVCWCCASDPRVGAFSEASFSLPCANSSTYSPPLSPFSPDRAAYSPRATPTV